MIDGYQGMHAITNKILVFVAFVTPCPAVVVKILIDMDLFLPDGCGKKRTGCVVKQFGGVDTVKNIA